MIHNQIIANGYSRQGNFGSPKAVLMGTNVGAFNARHRQRIFDFQGK